MPCTPSQPTGDDVVLSKTKPAFLCQTWPCGIWKASGLLLAVVQEAVVQEVQAHPQKFWFGENPGKIRGNLGKICESLREIPENMGKNNAQHGLIWKKLAPNVRRITWKSFLEVVPKKCLNEKNICRKSDQKIFRWSLGKYGQKSFAPLKICLLLHQWLLVNLVWCVCGCDMLHMFWILRHNCIAHLIPGASCSDRSAAIQPSWARCVTVCSWYPATGWLCFLLLLFERAITWLNAALSAI